MQPISTTQDNSMNKTDLRVIKTKETMHNALIELLHEKPFDEISAKDVIEKARVNRTTFYRYYSGLVSLIDEVIGDVKHEFAQMLANENCQTEQVFADFLNSRHKISALWKIHSRRYALYDDMHQMLRTAFLDELVKNKMAGHSVHYQAFMCASVCMESLRYAILYNEPMSLKQTSEDIKMLASLF